MGNHYQNCCTIRRRVEKMNIPKPTSSFGQNSNYNSINQNYKSESYSQKLNDPNNILQHKIINENENTDFQFLVSEMNNEQKLSFEINVGHAWAQNPKTIGTLCLVQISSFFSENENNDDFQQKNDLLNNVIEKLISQKILEKLQNNIINDQQDKVDWTIILLDFMVDYKNINQLIIQSNLFPQIIKKFNYNQNNIDFRISCFYIIRQLIQNNQQLINIFINDKEVMNSLKEFLNQNQIYIIIECLDTLYDILYTKQKYTDKLKLIKLMNREFLSILSNLKQKLQQIQATIKQNQQQDDWDPNQVNNALTLCNNLLHELK